jgi:hypothetical protein
MQITSNTTGMSAGLTCTTDKDGRDHCVVVVKGTFSLTGADGPRLAEEQDPLVATDVHHGDLGCTSLKYECEFALSKPRSDVTVNGRAVPPGGKPVRELTVALEIDSRRKEIRVVGDRRWEGSVLGFSPSPPEPFEAMPLVYERAFGGTDQTHPNPKQHSWELRNLVGTGFHRNSDPKTIEGRSLPNLESPRQPMRNWSDTPTPVGFGPVGRNWQPRARYAGTYDDRWLEDRFPFLPTDFDPQYFLSAPVDQQVPHLQGGEQIRCRNMTADGSLEFRVPRVEVPVLFRLNGRDVEATPKLDTLIVEPDRRAFLLVWRANVPLGRKLNALREVLVGRLPRAKPVRLNHGKRRFRSLDELAAWNRTQRPSSPSEGRE